MSEGLQIAGLGLDVAGVWLLFLEPLPRITMHLDAEEPPMQERTFSIGSGESRRYMWLRTDRSRYRRFRTAAIMLLSVGFALQIVGIAVG